MAKVEVKPIHKPVWFKNDAARAMIRPIKISCGPDVKTRRYSFPCSEEERKELENITGFDLSLEFKMNEVHPFFDSEQSRVTLSYGSNFFDTDNPIDIIKLYILKGSDLVANSMEEYEARKYPKAKFVITNTEEEENIKATKQALRRKAILEMSKLTTDKKVDILKILKGEDASKQSVDVIDFRLEQAIDSNPENFLKVLKRKPEDITVESLIISLINSRILLKEGTIVKYGDLIIGADMPSAVEFLKSPKNQTLKLQLQEKLDI